MESCGEALKSGTGPLVDSKQVLATRGLERTSCFRMLTYHADIGFGFEVRAIEKNMWFVLHVSYQTQIPSIPQPALHALHHIHLLSTALVYLPTCHALVPATVPTHPLSQIDVEYCSDSIPRGPNLHHGGCRRCSIPNAPPLCCSMKCCSAEFPYSSHPLLKTVSLYVVCLNTKKICI